MPNLAVAWLIGLSVLLGQALPLSPVRTLTLVDQSNRQLTLGSFEGRIVVLNFIFTRCNTGCSSQVRALSAVQRQLATSVSRKVQFVSISVDPEHDSAADLRDFAAQMGLDLRHWSLLTGSNRAVGELFRQLGIRAQMTSSGQVDHDLAVFLFNRRGTVVQKYRTAVLDRNRLVKEITFVASQPDHSTTRR